MRVRCPRCGHPMQDGHDILVCPFCGLEAHGNGELPDDILCLVAGPDVIKATPETSRSCWSRMPVVYDEPRYECPICQKKFIALADLQQHFVKKHLDGYCPVCDVEVEDVKRHIIMMIKNGNMDHAPYAYFVVSKANRRKWRPYAEEAFSINNGGEE